MRTASIAAFAATIVPSMLLSPVLEPRETKELKPVETRLEPLSQVSPAEAVATADSSAPTACAIPSDARPIARVTEVEPAIDEDLHCLALNIYHEARSEPLTGQIAVAQVTLNRVASEAFPESVCDVVKQGGQKRNRCQFSWWCDGKSDHPTEEKAWRKSLDLGRQILAEQSPDPTNGALYYHATYVSPKWSRSFQRTAQIGRHLFYRPASRPSQS
ncbi:cell wall hydrolase [Halochromatium sp.]